MTEIEKTNPENWKVGTSFLPGSLMQLEEIKNAGLDSIEFVLSSNELNLTYLGLKKRFDPYIERVGELGLEVWSVHLPFGSEWDISTIDIHKRNEILESHYEWLTWVSEWGIKRVIIHPSYEPIPENERLERIKACQYSLNLLAEKAKLLDIHICVEDLPRTCLGNTTQEMMELLKAHNNLKVCCDTNHLLSESPVDFIKQLGKSIATVHISDYDGIDEKHWLPGKGIIKWNEVINALAQSEYEGPFMFEVREDENDPKQLSECWNGLLVEYKET
ncbi:sugar phosphate isomerase/epimerase family protein [Bacillus niameyensis]|uniref:sugar phosphate isomerase/epimerase family protein n=1 Tax=Bacillus niameyensis TaxID=1522308 RepID=UPI0007862B4C|nr:sugar phosphate isomerase/epimerase family protein [Bacillus niameyensis]